MLDADYNAKVIDFGTACEFNPEEGMIDTVGTIMYMAPEILSRKGAYNQQSDCYSIGVLLFTMLTGKFCYSSKDKFLLKQ